MDEAEEDVLAYFDCPARHRIKLDSTDTLERRNGEVKRRGKVVGMFPCEASVLCPVGAVPLERRVTTHDRCSTGTCRST